MSAPTITRQAPPAGIGNGGGPARRAVIRWAWRLFRREWRQQLLVLALIIVAVGATVLGAAVATNTPPPANTGFGTAQDLATYSTPDPHLASQIAGLQHRFGQVDVIENQTLAVPGSVSSFDLRAQNPNGPFGGPMLQLVSGHYPTTASQVALTPDVASELGLRVGDVWHQGGPGGKARLVTGIVQNPQSLLDEFALVIPGQVTAPTQVTVLFNAGGLRPSSIGPNVQSQQSAAASNPINPETIVLALATVGMLLIALVAVGGFTVLAQRRLRALGMLEALGATDRHVRLVVRANGVVVGVIGALAGAVLGLAAWLAYRPSVEASAHHEIGAFQLPWIVIGPAMVLAVLATYFAAARPARAITRLSIVTALSGRPAPPKQVHRSIVPGVVLLVISVLGLWYAGKSSNGGGAPELLLGLVALIVALILLSGPCLAVVARLARHTPIAARLALRDLGRYRARSGSALAAISLGVLIAVLVCVLAAGRYGNVLDYAGPNVASNQIIVYTAGGPGGPGGGPGGPGGGPGGGSGNGTSGATATPSMATELATANGIAASLGSHEVIALDSTGASLQHAAPGRQWSGPVYVATPQLLAAFGIKASQVSPDADILSMRPGLSGISKMQLVYGNYFGSQGPGGGPNQNSFPCAAGSCLANPVIEEAGALPSGTSAPNTVITEHAIRQLGLHASVSGWLIQAPHNVTAAQITNARLTAANQGMTIETRSSAPSSAEIINWATVFGIFLALGILGMSVGLIRSETASDLRTLTATGADASTRRTITAVTAGALGLVGAVLGIAGAYIGAIAYSFSNHLDGLGELTNIPGTNLLIIGVGMPVFAAVAGWLLAGREPAVISRQPVE
jgi:putative ABC transport system permease protein